ncbi:ferrochelatase hem15 [Pycnococcus provasolii]|uniref:Ferrochelatase n=1 Tax=Pycnococcus provasolii TaxID=41880 RepID=A0A830HRJ1_9CHLO|nr:ferrochelatase hem15 [Pycnococcus provasolii]
MLAPALQPSRVPGTSARSGASHYGATQLLTPTRRIKRRNHRRHTAPAAAASSTRPTSSSSAGGDTAQAQPPLQDKVGVLLLNLGGPETLDDVQPFLYNLFSDEDIIRLPEPIRFLQRPLAQAISIGRAPKSAEGYASIGGGSPLRRITEQQAEALLRTLQTKFESAKNVSFNVYVGMRYWYPFTEEALEKIKSDGITRLVILPLYPQFSVSTSGSSLRLLETLLRDDPYLASIRHTVIPSWYNRVGYVESMADLIEEELKTAFKDDDVRGSANIFFSAHGVPRSYVEEAGDPYKEEMEASVSLIMSSLRRRGVMNEYTLAYQSRVGPVEWLTPYTDDVIRQLGEGGTDALLAVPISFVSEHIETLEEIDVEYRELAEESGITNWGRVPALNTNQRFIDDLALAVIEALPYADSLVNPGDFVSADGRQSLVPTGITVEDLVALYDNPSVYDKQPSAIEASIVSPGDKVPWYLDLGWTENAEKFNGRLAMLAILALIVVELATDRPVVNLAILPVINALM